MAPPLPDTAEAARRASSYSASLRVSLKGPSLRARTRTLVAFLRPDGLRIEVPGPTGPRVVAVARGGRVWAVFPADRAVFEGEATADALESLLGVSLTPDEVMDVLVGVRPARVSAYEAGWDARLPRRIVATLPDGARLTITVDEADLGVALSPGAFAAPPHEGFRVVDVEEARRLGSGR